MFSQACVKNSVHKGVYTPLDTHPPPGHTPALGRHPPPTATTADGTHPTGMHSCFIVFCELFENVRFAEKLYRYPRFIPC